jgi:hypothetical protein
VEDYHAAGLRVPLELVTVRATVLLFPLFVLLPFTSAASRSGHGFPSLLCQSSFVTLPLREAVFPRAPVALPEPKAVVPIRETVRSLCYESVSDGDISSSGQRLAVPRLVTKKLYAGFAVGAGVSWQKGLELSRKLLDF